MSGSKTENIEIEMGTLYKAGSNWMFHLCERFKKRFALNPVNYILKIIFKD